MHILITNDDGISSEGIAVLARELSRDHEVWVVAPDRERSAVSQGITFREPVKFHRLSCRRYACSGTPADCVLYSFHGAVDAQFDLVVSGINRGENIGTDILYSGTVAAARQAVLQGVPALAVSSGADEPAYQEAASLVASHIELFKTLSDARRVININVPSGYRREAGMVSTVPCLKKGGNRVDPYYRNEHESFYFLSEFREESIDEHLRDTDVEALNRGYASVTPLEVQPSWDREGMVQCEEFFPRLGQRS